MTYGADSHRIQQHLESREKLQWHGRPNPTAFMKKGLGGTLFALVWLGAVVYMAGNITGYKIPAEIPETDDLIPLIMAAVFALIGLKLLFQPLFKYLEAQKLLYAVTNKRVIVFKNNQVTGSYAALDFDEVSVQEKADGSGSITLQKRSAKHAAKLKNVLTLKGVSEAGLAVTYIEALNA